MANNFVQQTAAKQSFGTTTAAVPTEVVVKDISLRLDQMRPEMEGLLSQKFDKFRESVALAIVKNPGLATCERQSLLMAVKQAAHYNLDPNPDLKLVYFTPYKNQVKLVAGYRGLIELARRSNVIRDIKAVLVYANDEFLVEESPEQRLTHKPVVFGDKGELLGAYAIAWFKDGTYRFDIVDQDYITKVRNTSQTGNSENGVWAKWFEEQVKKTAIRRLCKTLPQSSDVLNATLQDENDLPSDVVASEEYIDHDTGEVWTNIPVEAALTPSEPAPVEYIEPETVNIQTTGFRDDEIIQPEPPIDAYYEQAQEVQEVMPPEPIVSNAAIPPGYVPPARVPNQKTASVPFGRPPVKKEKKQEPSQDLKDMFSGTPE